MSSLKLRQFAVVMGCLLFCLPAFAQLNLGRITGAVTDQTGGVIVGATVTISDVARGVNRPLTTDSAGEYNAPSLTPGLYTVRAEAMGFKAVERQNVAVEVGGQVRVDLTLQPGDQTQTVTVTEALPNIDTTNASLGGTLQSQSLAELPINGRDVLKLLNYTPGSTTTDGKMFNINGGRTNDQVYIFDGIDELNPYGTGPIVGGTSGFTGATILPLDAIQDTNIITTPNAEYGWKFGGIVNLGMKSGTNAIHGTAFALGRDNALDAKNPFLLPTQPKAADTLEQFGATVGGPIKKDKMFYFLAYEGQRYLVATPGILQSPAALAGSGKTGSIPTAIADLVANGVTPSALSLRLAGCPTVAPYTPCTGGIFFNPTGSSSVSAAIPNSGGSDNGLGKVDYHINDRNSLNGEYFIGQGNSNQQSASNSTAEPWWLTAKFTRSQLGRAVWIWTPSSTLLNEMRFGIDREYQTGSPAECTQNLGQPNYAAAYGFVIQPVPAPLCGFPLTTITGFTPLGTTETSGGPSQVTYTTFAGIDTVSYTRGKHQFKFGFEIHNTVFTGSTKLNYVHGKLTFGSVNAFPLALGITATPLEDFLAGQVAQSQILVGSPLIHTNLPRYAGFAQDDWRITPRVTVNLGLRYEIIPPMSGNNQLGSFSNTQGLEQVGLQTKSLYPTYYKAFAPRIGVAWDVTGKGKTVVKAGGNIVYDMNPINSFLSPAQAAAVNIIPTGFKLYAPNGSLLPSPGTLQTANLVGTGNSLVNWTPGVPVFITNTSKLSCGNGLAATAPGTGTNPQPCNIQPVAPNLTPAYMITYTLGVQQAITNSMSINVAYVGTRGQNLQQNIDINQPLPGAKNTSTLLNEQSRRPFYAAFPYLGQITELTGGAESTYNALQVQLKEQATRGLTLSASYTYAHTLSSADNTYGSYHENYTNPKADFAPAFYDIHNALNLNFTYQIPSFKAPAQLLKGWEVNSVLSVLSAQPYPTSDTSSDLSGTGELLDRWSIAGNPANIKSGVGPIPCFGVPNSSFANTSNCTTVAAGTVGSMPGSTGYVANMPAACVAAAAAEPTNINATSGVTATTTNSTGLWSLASFGCYYENGTAIVAPAQGTFGNMGRNALRNGLPFREWDLSIAKQWTLTERFKAQFRAEFYNVLNHPIFAVPNSNPAAPSSFGQTTALNNQSDPILGEGGPRQINLLLKFTF